MKKVSEILREQAEILANWNKAWGEKNTPEPEIEQVRRNSETVERLLASAADLETKGY